MRARPTPGTHRRPAAPPWAGQTATSHMQQPTTVQVPSGRRLAQAQYESKADPWYTQTPCRIAVGGPNTVSNVTRDYLGRCVCLGVCWGVWVCVGLVWVWVVGLGWVLLRPNCWDHSSLSPEPAVTAGGMQLNTPTRTPKTGSGASKTATAAASGASAWTHSNTPRCAPRVCEKHASALLVAQLAAQLPAAPP